MRKSIALILAGGVSLGIIATAGPAFADANPVHATVRVATVLSLDGISPAVDFSTVIPGQTSTVQGAEAPHIITNGKGVDLFVNPANGGFKYQQGGVDQIPNSAVTVTTPGQGSVALGFGPVKVASVGSGEHTLSQDWSISVPISVAASDPGQSLFADFNYSAVSN